MKVLLIYGSPRHKKSASYHLGENFAKGMERAGAEVDEIMLCKQKINHCIGCFTCWTKTPGKCIHNDDMADNLPKIEQADLIVYAVPLYIYTIPGLVKDFMDRSLPLFEPYLIEEKGFSSHPKRVPKTQNIFLISVAGFPELSHFDSLVHLFKKRYRRDEYVGEILVGGSELMSMDSMQYRYKKLYDAMEQAGYELVKNGKISADTKKAIEKETIVPKNKLKLFREMANKYWDSLLPKEYSKVQLEATNDKLLEISDGGMGAFFAGMASQYNPNVLSGLKAVLQFNLENERYYLKVNQNICKAYKGSYPNPTLTINSPKDVWIKISTGKLEGADALMNGLYKVEGDFKLLMKMNDLFSSDDDDTKATKPSNKVKQKTSQKTSKQAKLLSVSAGGNAAFFAGMAAQFNPHAEPDLKPVIQFKLEDENYHLVVQGNECKAYEGIHPDPTVTVNTSADVWMKISSGELNGAKAFMKKMYTVDGDMGILLKLNRLFSGEEEIADVPSEPQISARTLEKIPETRGPLKIPAMLWLNVAFVPWIIFWIWHSIAPGFLPMLSVALVSLVITLYHLKTNRPTLFEYGSCVYLIMATLLYWMGIEFFITYIRMINNIYLGALWLISLTKTFSLTAEYSRHGLPRAIWNTRAFLDTNNILTGLWGIYFLCSAIMDLVAITYSELSLVLMIVEYLLLIPMFLFTSWFQKWYPSKVM